MKQINFSLSQIKKIAAQLWNENSQYKTWAFHAEMGAGKTTLIHALCDVLQVKNSVSSPTFAIISEYTSSVAGKIFHMDWYRLKDEAEAIQAGCEDCIESGDLCFIEWSEKFPNLLPANTLHISMETMNEHERSIIIHND
ncbi:MAG: tRNA (adenosine(37)-N6)-threonylcarbamoyltransferase complex ATPase subunit type 1 TsaE [Parafilimonas sp.]